MPLYSAAIVVVLGLTIAEGLVRITLGGWVHDRNHDFEMSFLLRWPIRVIFNVIVPLWLIGALTRAADRVGFFDIVLSYLVLALLVGLFIAVLQRLLDRLSPTGLATPFRLFVGHERDTRDDYLRKPEAEAALEGEMAAAAEALAAVNARFARGAEFLKEFTRPTFSANCEALSAAIARLQAAVDAAPVAPLEAIGRLNDARSRLRTLQEPALRNRVGA